MEALAALRTDLVIKRQSYSGGTTYIVKDPVKNAYLSFAEEEHYVLKQLDGKKTAADIAALYNHRFHDDLTAEDIIEFIASIRNKDLLERSLLEKNVFLYEQLKEQRKSRIRHAKGSVFYFRIPLVDPNAFFDRFIPYIRWYWTPVYIWLSLLFMFSSVVILLANYSSVAAGLSASFNIFNQDIASLALLWATVLVVIAIHELGHGFTCKRFGGECHEIGFLFMFFTPCMYCNVNDAWMFDNRQERLYVNFAGCYIEFLVGSIAVYVWALTQPGILIHAIAFKVIVVCFFSAVFMNFNPLMKYDGYFALSDYLETPNLRTRSREYVVDLIQTKIFRLKRETESLTQRERRILGNYGVLSTVYLVNVMCGLLIMAAGFLIRTFHWVGLLVTGVLIYKLFGTYIRKLIGFMQMVMTEHSRILHHRVVRISALGLLAAMVLFAIAFPLRWHVEVPTTLSPVHEIVIRTQSSGYVIPLKTHSRSFKKGVLIMTLESPQLDLQIHQLEIERRKNKYRLHAAIADGDASEKARLEELGRKLLRDFEDLDRQQQALTLHAPFDGVLTEALDRFENTFVQTGETLGHFMRTDGYQAALEIPERAIEDIRVDTRAKLLLNSRPDRLFAGKVTMIAPVHTKRDMDRFYRVIVNFPNENQLLRSGLNGVVHLEVKRGTLFVQLLRWIRKTIRLDLQI
jgi:putative peptide zinc metalloprotease protein